MSIEITKTDDTLTLVRTFDAPVERVFAAWTTPALVEQWWGCDQCESVTATIDARVGGTFTTVMAIRGHGDHTSVGEYVEFEPNRRVKVRSDYEGNEMVVTVDFESMDDDKTKVTLEQRGFPFPGAQDMIAAGFTHSLDKLEKTLAA